jgi:Flp pilus assembly protein TadG
MNRARRRGNAVLEFALWFPVLLLLVVGMVEFGRVEYLQYSLRKALYTVGRTLSVQQGLDLCNADALAVMVRNLIADPNTQEPLVSNLTADMIQVSAVCLDANGNPLSCDTSGCTGITAAPQQPAFLTVSIPGGYPFQLRIPYTQLSATPLFPTVTVPFSGSVL